MQHCSVAENKCGWSKSVAAIMKLFVFTSFIYTEYRSKGSAEDSAEGIMMIQIVAGCLYTLLETGNKWFNLLKSGNTVRRIAAPSTQYHRGDNPCWPFCKSVA
jgi:hypothetical protein